MLTSNYGQTQKWLIGEDLMKKEIWGVVRIARYLGIAEHSTRSLIDANKLSGFRDSAGRRLCERQVVQQYANELKKVDALTGSQRE